MNPELEVDRREDLLDVRDQGQLPTCLSYATSTVHRVIKDIDVHLSAETLHYHATEEDLTRGSKMREIQQALREEGQPKHHHCASVSRENSDTWSPPEDVTFYRAESNRETPSPRVIKDALIESELPILGLSLPAGFYHPEPPWVISAGEPQGHHAVVAVGLAQYNDETAVLIRNSWGNSWAKSGHALLDNSFLEKHLKDVLILSAEGEK